MGDIVLDLGLYDFRSRSFFTLQPKLSPPPPELRVTQLSLSDSSA